MSPILSNAEQAALSVLEMLRHAQKHPGMYFAPVDFCAADNFFGGVGVGASRAIGELRQINVCRVDARRARGYHTFSLDEFESALKRRCTDGEHVIIELFEIEIDAWNRMLDSLRSTSSSTTV